MASFELCRRSDLVPFYLNSSSCEVVKLIILKSQRSNYYHSAAE